MGVLVNRSAMAVVTTAVLLSGSAAVAVGAAADAGKGQHVRLEEVSRVVTLEPGATVDVSAQCAENEAVTSGSPTSWPAGVRAIGGNVWWDGVHSGGWTVTFKNTTKATVNGQVSVAAICVAPGYMTH